ncbi:MAG: PIN domain-containing protein [Nanoarchaeota archaeon]|nr:PIN domain-containing protein [Nanoarchaeota archaeon]
MKGKFKNFRRRKNHDNGNGNDKTSQEIKEVARKSLTNRVSTKRANYVVDTSAVIHKFIPEVIRRGIRGKIIIPNAVMAELENQANKGLEYGFIGLEEISNLHNLSKKYPVKVEFEGIRPQDMHIRYAKSGEIDALIRSIAVKYKATLITADLVQAKSAQAYKLNVIYLKPSKPEKKRGWLSRIFRKS